MSGWNVFGFIISALISALVAILVTGKINSNLADRAIARRLRLRAARVLLVGPERQQSGWWGLSKDELNDVSTRLVALSEDAIAVDAEAAQAFGHATQMLPVLWVAMGQWKQLGETINKECEKAGDYPDDDQITDIRRIVESSIKCRDDALSAIATVYRDLLRADQCLSKIGRWLRIIDWHAEVEPPQHYQRALKYAEDHLVGASPWSEPSESKLEQLRVWLIAAQTPPDTYKDIDKTEIRRNLVSHESLFLGDLTSIVRDQRM
jgi:hypothetical protein